MTDRVKVLIADDPDHEDLIAEIQVDGDCVAVLSQNGGKLQIEIDRSWIWSGDRKKLSLTEFELALKQAETSLRKMKKKDPGDSA